MTHYNSLNVKPSSSEPNKLESAIKKETEAVLRLSSNMIGNRNDETNFPQKFLLTNGHVHKYQSQLCISRKLKKKFL